MADDRWQTHYLTREQAVAYIKKHYRKGVQYRVGCRPFAYTVAPPECAEGQNPRGWEQYASVEVSQRQAIKFVHDAIHDVFAERGVRLEVKDCRPETTTYDTGGSFTSPGMIILG